LNPFQNLFKKNKMKRKALLSKVDMDTCLTAFILGIRPKDEVIVIQENANDQSINNPNLICIECVGEW